MSLWGPSVGWRGKRKKEHKHRTKPLQHSVRNAAVEEHTERCTEKVIFSELGRVKLENLKGTSDICVAY